MIQIIPMGKSHVPQVAELERICFSSPWSEKSIAEEFENTEAVFLVAVEKEKLLGYGGMHTPYGDCYIDNIAVFPEARGMGIGRKITEALVLKAEEIGGSFISLEVRPSNLPAVNLYTSMGFEQAGRRKNFYTNPTEDGLIMTKVLDAERTPLC